MYMYMYAIHVTDYLVVHSLRLISILNMYMCMYYIGAHGTRLEWANVCGVLSGFVCSNYIHLSVSH